MQPPPHRPRPPELPMCVTREQTLSQKHPRLTRRWQPSWPVDWWIACGIALTCRQSLVLHYEAESCYCYATLTSGQGTLQGVQGEGGSKRTGFRRG